MKLNPAISIGFSFGEIGSFHQDVIKAKKTVEKIVIEMNRSEKMSIDEGDLEFASDVTASLSLAHAIRNVNTKTISEETKSHCPKCHSRFASENSSATSFFSVIRRTIPIVILQALIYPLTEKSAKHAEAIWFRKDSAVATTYVAVTKNVLRT